MRNTDLKFVDMSKRTTLQKEVETCSKARRTKTVHFADDCGFLLVRNYNLPETEKKPIKKLSKLSNFTECEYENDEIYLESTLTNRTSVFGTIVSRNPNILCDELKIIYSWDNNNYRSTLPYLLGSNKRQRFLFKINVPKKFIQKDENKSVRFYIQHNCQRLKNLNDGKDFNVMWHPC